MKRPRPLTPTETQQLATDLTTLTALLNRPDITRILTGIATAATPGYPRTTSGHPNNGGSSSGGGADLLDALTEPITTYATELLTDLHHYRTGIPALISALTGWTPDRAVAKCPRCDHPLRSGDKICRHTNDDGTPCHATPDADPLCRDCAEPMPVGDRHGGMHDRCRKAKTRTGYTRASMVTYQARFGEAWSPEGVYHA